MPATATIVGALLGLGTQMYSNALRKLPYMRREFLLFSSYRLGFSMRLSSLFSRFHFVSRVSDPWEHVLGMGLGAIFVHQLVKWDEKLKEDLDKMLDKAKAANERRYFGQCVLLVQIQLFSTVSRPSLEVSKPPQPSFPNLFTSHLSD
ncbi:hypothetical protein Sjap_026274 [Stephania japonica]|uniref:Uncharacterized protein n=1 Tax=Stephania japonica TaxID=461633 RepID=A0AAP0E6D6_9MAGN